ncbi:MAG: DUF3775 domain-containing protein [Hyphomicrobiaceae bacterium]
MLQIPPNKVGRIIVWARQFDAQVAPWADNADREDGDDIEATLEETSDNPVAAELATYIDELNDDEQASLVAVMWIGRGTYEADELDDAIATARSERTNKTSAYLMGSPLLADYLEEGLEKLGYSIEDAEDDNR